MTSGTDSTTIQVPGGDAVPIAHLYATADAAAYLDITKMTLWRWVRDGKISTVRIGRHNLFLRSAMDKLLSARDAV
ncbi:MAG: helix-turn-helix domain-containing protein [Candidatus Bathyanammoxibius sp.]